MVANNIFNMDDIARDRSEELEKLTKEQIQNAPPFQLLETMLFTPDKGVVFLERHIERLARSATAFGPDLFVPPDVDAIKALVLEEVAGAKEPMMMRLLYGRDRANVEVSQVNEDMLKASKSGKTRKVSICGQRVSSSDLFLRHKTTYRDVYMSARAQSGVSQGGVFDCLLVNEHGDITETSIANIAIETEEGEWVTPPESAGLLPGVMRAELLDSGMLVERKVTLEDAISAAKAGRRIICFNSVRGLYDVELKLD